MPKVKYVGPHASVWLKEVDVVVEQGTEVDVPAAVASELVKNIPDEWVKSGKKPSGEEE